MKRHAARLRLLFVLFILASALYLSRHIVMAELGRRLVVEDPVALADAAVLLAGDYEGERLQTAAKLWRDHVVPKIYVSGPSGIYGINEADAAIQFALRAGYPAEAFVVAKNTSRSTAEEADQLLPMLRAQPGRRLAIVTSNYHTRRAARVWRAKAPDFDIRIVAAPCAIYPPDAWWTTRDGQKTFLFEWEKTIAAWAGL